MECFICIEEGSASAALAARLRLPRQVFSSAGCDHKCSAREDAPMYLLKNGASTARASPRFPCHTAHAMYVHMPYAGRSCSY